MRASNRIRRNPQRIQENSEEFQRIPGELEKTRTQSKRIVEFERISENPGEFLEAEKIERIRENRNIRGRSARIRKNPNETVWIRKI